MISGTSHQIFFVRHGETRYSQIYPDITDNGIRDLKKISKIIRDLNEDRDFVITSSPAIRAMGSADILAHELGYTGNVLAEPLLGDMNITNWEKALKIFGHYTQGGRRIEEFYDVEDSFEDVSVFEPRMMIRKRFFSYLGKVYRDFLQAKQSQSIIAISHFEILNHFLHGLWPDSSCLPFAGMFRMTFRHAPQSNNLECTVLYQERSIIINSLLTHQ